MTTGAAEGWEEMPGANPEWSGRKPKGAGAGAAWNIDHLFIIILACYVITF